MDQLPEWLINNPILVGSSLIGVILLFVLLRLLFRRKPIVVAPDDYDEYLEDLPEPPSLTGDRRLLVEGVPVRLRLVVIAGAGHQTELGGASIRGLLAEVVGGLGDICIDDEPKVRLWPRQLSAEGFARTFFRTLRLPDDKDDADAWVLVAGRAKARDQHVMIGLALLARKPTTIGKRALQPHEWSSVLRVRTRD